MKLTMAVASWGLLVVAPMTVAAYVSPRAPFGVVGGKRSASASASRSALKMATFGPMNCRPIGIGSATPKTLITNVDLESVVETSDEWIRSRTGIAQRRVLQHLDPTQALEAGEEVESLKSLGTQAAKNALEMSGLDPLDIDLVICATSSPDDMFGDATSIAAGLGATNAFAYDLTAACSGFLFGTVTAGQFLHCGSIKNAIVVGADALSRWVDWEDRNSCILFGDGAGAMVLTNTPDTTENSITNGQCLPGILGYAAHSNGKGYNDLKCAYEGTGQIVATPGEGTTVSKGSYQRMSMNGREVYKFATREVPTVLKEALDAAGLTVDDVDWLLLHQANIRIMETVANRLGMPMEKVITNLSDYGNTSAASIPLALDEAVRKGQVKKGDIIACAGFGAGLSWGSAIIRWD
jgi:3-oxoacyl-[acyl-carrier-protein] synthase-3